MSQDDWVYREPERDRPRRPRPDPRRQPPAAPWDPARRDAPRDPRQQERYERPTFRPSGYGQPSEGYGPPRPAFPGPGAPQGSRAAPSFTAPAPVRPPAPQAPAPEAPPKPPAPAKQKASLAPLGCGLAILAVAAGITWWVVAAGSAPQPDLPVLSQYEQAIDTMQANCTGTSDQLEDAVSSAYSTLSKAGVPDLTVASVAAGMADMTAGNSSPMDCSDEFADYISQQEGH